MERCNLAQLNNALTETETPLERQLPDEESIQLALIVDQMQVRYPSQDTAETVDGVLWDLERLAMRYSTPAVAEALAELRIKPGQKYFPRPDEVAEEIERQKQTRARASEQQQRAARRSQEIAEFWQWAEQWMRDTRNTEEELLRRFPSYRGTKQISEVNAECASRQ